MTTTMTMGLCCVHSCAPRWGLLQKTTPLLCLSSSIAVLSLHISSKNQQLRLVCLWKATGVCSSTRHRRAHTILMEFETSFHSTIPPSLCLLFFYERLNVTFFISAPTARVPYFVAKENEDENLHSLAGLGSSLSVIFSRECVCGKQWNLLVENLIVLIKKRVMLTLMELY